MVTIKIPTLVVYEYVQITIIFYKLYHLLKYMHDLCKNDFPRFDACKLYANDSWNYMYICNCVIQREKYVLLAEHVTQLMLFTFFLVDNEDEYIYVKNDKDQD